MRHTTKILLVVMALVCPVGAAISQTTSAAVSSYHFDIDAAKKWVDTNLDLRSGEKIRFTATGNITYPQGPQGKPPARTFGPEGLARGWSDLIHQYAVSEGGHGALIAEVGSGDAAQPFLVGASKEFTAPVAGRLSLGINQS